MYRSEAPPLKLVWRWRARAEHGPLEHSIAMREANRYHVTKPPDGIHWDGIEYYSARLRRGVLYAFRGTMQDESMHRYRLRGLHPDRRYRVRFQDRGSAADHVLAGRELLQAGVAVTLTLPLSSELIFIEEIS